MKDFSNEYKYLVHLVRCALNNEVPAEKPGNLSFEKIKAIAIRHDVANLAFYSIEKLNIKPEESCFKDWGEIRDLCIVRDINQQFAHTQMLNAFETAGIRSVEIQGTRIKPLYPVSEYRTMSDIDICVDKENIFKVKDILEGLGYSCTVYRKEDIVAQRPPVLNVEIHTGGLCNEYDLTPYIGGIFDVSAPEKGLNYRTPDRFMYIHTVVHIAKHYYGDGCGIRRIADAFYIQKFLKSEEDRTFVDGVLKEIGLLEFDKSLCALALYWFGNGEYEEGFEEMEKRVFSSGLHGTMDNRVSLELEKKGGKLKYTLSRVFLAPKTMKRRYPTLRKHIYLLPLFWVYRAVNALIFRRTALKNEIDILKK